MIKARAEERRERELRESQGDGLELSQEVCLFGWANASSVAVSDCLAHSHTRTQIVALNKGGGGVNNKEAIEAARADDDNFKERLAAKRAAAASRSAADDTDLVREERRVRRMMEDERAER